MTRFAPRWSLSCVTSLAADASGARILAATGDGVLHEMAVDGGAMTKLLSAPAPTGTRVATHPTDPDTVATCGTDGALRLWSLSRHRQTAAPASLGLGKAVSLAWEQGGVLIAVGCLTDVGTAALGVYAFDPQALALAGVCKPAPSPPSKSAVTAVNFGAGAAVLAAGCADGLVAIYRADGNGGFALKAVCERHSAPVVALDVSANGKAVRSACTARELVVSATADGAVVAPPKAGPLLADTTAAWTTASVPFGWSVKGAWGALGGGLGVVCCALGGGGDRRWLVAARADGSLDVYRWPAVEATARAARVASKVVGGPPTSVGVSAGGRFVVAAAADGAVSVHRVVWAGEE